MSADASLVPAQDAEPDEPGEDAPLLQLTKKVERLEEEASETRLRTELLDQAVGVPKPGASAADRLRLLVMGQVNSKLARFGPTRGTIIASLVLLCNAAFIWAFVAGTTSNCEQRSAIMDPEPMISDTYTNMFDSGNTHVCASYIHATQVYTRGDTCTVVPSEEEKEENPSGWLAKNGVCDSDRCAPGTDCTDCPTDPLCEPGRDGFPLDTSDTCACEQDDFCCSQWDVACGLCELGLDQESLPCQPTYVPHSMDPATMVRTDSCTASEWLGEIDTILPPSLADEIRYLEPSIGGSFIRTSTCAANSCSGQEARVEQIFRSTWGDKKLRLSVLHEEHVYPVNAHNVRMPPEIQALNGDPVQWSAQRVPDLAGPLLVPGSVLGNAGACTYSASGSTATYGAAPYETTEYTSTFRLAPLESRLPGCGFSADIGDMSAAQGYVDAMLGPEMSVHSTESSCDRFDLGALMETDPYTADECSSFHFELRSLVNFPDFGTWWDASACGSIEPTACGNTCQEGHCNAVENTNDGIERNCPLLPGCTLTPGVCSNNGMDWTSYYDSQGTCEGAGLGSNGLPYTWQPPTCDPRDETPSGGVDGQFWTRGPAQAKIDQCSAFHRLQYDSCYDPGETCIEPAACIDPATRQCSFSCVDGGTCGTKPDCTARPMGPLYRDGVCQVDTGQCAAGTDCSDCPSDPACPGVGEQRLTPCHLQGVPCEQYVQEKFGADSALAEQCGMPDSLTACADKDCSDPTVSAKKEIAASVLYVTCPKMATQLGVGMGYLFLVEMLAIAATVTGAVLLSGGSFSSAWDQTRSILRGEMATEAAEAATLLDEEKRLGSPSPKEQKKEKVKLGDVSYVATPQQKEAKAPGNSTAVAPDPS
eukprot:COSAG04_NODE_859_length_9813_cov_35.427836_5_plen_875_part_00